MASKTARLVNRKAFLEAASFRERDVTLENIGTVRIRELSVADRIRYMEYIKIGEDKKTHMDAKETVEFNRFIVSMGLLNGDVTKDGEEGTLMFPSPDDIPDAINFDVLDSLANAILDISHMLVKPVEAKKNLKNPPETKAISDTSSPSSSG